MSEGVQHSFGVTWESGWKTVNGAAGVVRICAVDVLGARAQRFDARLQRNHRPAGGQRRTYCFSVGIGIPIPLTQ